MEAPEHEIWLTKLFNNNLAPVGNSILNLVGLPSQHRPWANLITMLILAPLLIPIEIISHMARPLSLTIRLYANMLAGEKVTVVFLGLTYFGVPAIFMGLHVFVSFLQAYIFVLMTMMYVNGAVAHE